MSGANHSDYTILDRPELLSRLFHPRKQYSMVEAGSNCREVSIQVDQGVHLGGRFHLTDNPIGTILFFHGNGEIASDYDDLGPLFTQMGIRFLVVDYRGYGRSDGDPTITTMLSDSHLILAYVREFLSSQKCPAPLVVMGRSLGSAAALELAYSHPKRLAGLIVESGFAYVVDLLQRLGVSLEHINFKEEHLFGNIDKIKVVTNPTLIIHAEYDHIIPFSDGATLYESSAASQKTFLKVPHADHNNIFAFGHQQYMAAIRALMTHLSKGQQQNA